jgi:hypothetical protein
MGTQHVALSVGALCLWLAWGAGAPLAAQASDTSSYYYAGHAVPLTIHLDSLGVYAPGVPEDAVTSLAGSLQATGWRALGKGLWVLGFGQSRPRSALVDLARQAVVRGAGTVRAAGLVVRRDQVVYPAIVTDQFIVEFQPAISQAAVESLNAPHGVRIVRRLEVLNNDYLLATTRASTADVLDLAKLYSQDPAVVFATPNFYGVKREQAFIPNDQLFGSQWHLDNPSDADIDAPEAWDISRGSASVTIAILEPFGFDVANPDLVNKVDLAWNFDGCGDTDDFGLVSPCGGTTFSDQMSHGTAVAGLAAAEGNNTEGVAGVCLECRLMLFDLPADDAATSLTVAHVAARGVDVINNSWTWGYSNDHTLGAFVKAAEVVPGKKGIVVVFSTEDDRKDHCTDAAGLKQLYADPDLIGVSASNNLDRRAFASTIGPCVELVAPGYFATVITPGDTVEQLGVTTTDRPDRAGYNDDDPLPGILCPFTEPTDASHINGRAYTRCFSGGSAAAPIVAGVAGLLRSHRPCLTRIQVQQILRETADKIGPPGTYDPGGHSDSYGYGRVNAAAALQAASAISCGDSEVAEHPSFEIGTRVGVTALLANTDQTVANGPGGGPMAQPVLDLSWFPSSVLRTQLQVGGSFVTPSLGPHQTNLVFALQAEYGMSGFGTNTPFVGLNLAYQYLDTGTPPTTNDVALGSALGYRWLPLGYLALTLEARYRYWFDRNIHEVGGALGFGVVLP